MINLKLNGKTLKVPASWEDVTFDQYIKYLRSDGNNLKVVSIFTEIPEDVLLNPKTEIVGFDNIITALDFLNDKPEFEITYKLGKYTIPKDITFESPAQYFDMKACMINAADVISCTEKYADILAIYVQKIRDGAYDQEKAKAMVPDIMKMPAGEVLSAGSLFIVKLLNLSKNTPKTSLKQVTKSKKSRQGLTSSRKRSARR